MTHTKIDPVFCGMQVAPQSAIAGDTYYFCESACADTFRDDPDRWIPQASTVEG